MANVRCEAVSLRLTRTQRALLFNRQTVTIAGENPCPVEPGFVYSLSPHVQLHVKAVLPRRGGGWKLRYELHDKRDRPSYLRRTPTIHSSDFQAIRDGLDEYGYPCEPSPETLSAAADESAYTYRPTSLGERVDRETVERFAQDNRARFEVLHGEELGKRDTRSQLERLKRASREAHRRGVNAGQIIDRAIGEIERELREDESAA
jgi:hypothetical protein